MALRRVPKSMISGLVIETADIANNAVTPEKIPDGSITNAKLNVPSGTQPQHWRTTDPDGTDLFQTPQELQQFRIRQQFTVAGVVFPSAHVDIRHRGAETGYHGVVGYSIRVLQRYGADETALDAASFNQLKFAVSGGNVLSTTHHYGKSVIPGPGFVVSAGWWEFTLEGSAHTTGDPRDGLLDLNQFSAPSDANFFQIAFYAGATITDL